MCIRFYFVKNFKAFRKFPLSRQSFFSSCIQLNDRRDEQKRKTTETSTVVVFEPFDLDDGPKVAHHHPTDGVCEISNLSVRKRGLKYWLRHPYLRILTAYLVVFCNFLIFAEDPVSHSHSDCVIDVIGNIYAFMFSR